MIKLAPSILAADFNILGKQITMVEDAGVEYLHIDVMDGNFVPSISFGMPVIASIRKNTNLVFDVHLMLEEPIRYIKAFKEAGADIITVHYEACKELHKTIMLIRELGLRVGVSLNPETGIEVLDDVIKDIDMVLIMSVNPGFGGQAFIPVTLKKIRDLREKADMAGAHIDIEVDGGITTDNVLDIIEAGANIIVSGTTVFSGDIITNIAGYHKIFTQFENNK